MATLSKHDGIRVEDGPWSAFNARAGEVLPDLRRVAARLANDHDDASELVQQTLIRMWRREGTYSGKGSYAGWAVAILRNLWKDGLRRTANEPDWVSLEECADFPAPNADILDEMWERRRATALHAALGRLTRAERRAFVAHHVDGTSFSEIAGELGVSRRQATVLVRRACRKLRSQEDLLEFVDG